MREVLINLVGNSVKFTHVGEIYIKVELDEGLGDRSKILFLVKDTGIGVERGFSHSQGISFIGRAFQLDFDGPSDA